MTHREKVEMLIADLGKRGVSAYTVAPPMFRALRAMGLRIRPPLYLGFFSLTLLMGIYFGPIWGLLMWLFWWRPAPQILAIVSLTAGAFFGLSMATYYRWKAKHLNLPSWEKYPLPLKPCPFTIRFVIHFKGRWASLEELGISASDLWDYFLLDRPEWAEFGPAILINVDGIPWNTEEHSESLDHIESWLDATAALLEGAPYSDVWAWEESGMGMCREGNAVILEERTHHEHMRLIPICLDLREFAQALVNATAPAVKVIDELKNRAAKESGDDWRQLSTQWREYVGEQEIRLMSEAEFERQKALGNQSEEELRRARFLGYKPTGRPKDQYGQHLAGLLDYLRHEGFTSSWNRLVKALDK
jgi:hypothetical protein